VRLLIPVPLFDRAISFLCGTGLAQIFGWAIPQSLELWLTPGLLLAGHFLSKGFREVVSPPEKMAQLRWGMLCLWLILGLIHSGCALWPGQGISSLEGAKVRGAGSILSVKELAAGPGAGPRQQWVVQLQRQDAEGAEQTRLWLKQERVLLTLQWPTASGQAMDGQAAGPADYSSRCRDRLQRKHLHPPGPPKPRGFRLSGVSCGSEAVLHGGGHAGQPAMSSTSQPAGTVDGGAASGTASADPEVSFRTRRQGS